MNDTYESHTSKIHSLKVSDIFSLAIGNGYPRAFWRMPGKEQINGVIDLTPEKVANKENIEDFPTGFAVNPFLKHHPSTPSLIKADVTVSWNRQDGPSVSFAPTVRDQQIDRFLNDEKLNSAPGGGSLGNGTLNYQRSVAEAVEIIKQHQLDKVVISRYDDIALPESFDVFDTFINACDQYPNAFSYLLFTPEHGLWMGATPESLLSLTEGRYFETVSLAGTQKLDDDQSLNDVAWTQKEIEEQAMVSRYVIECLKR